METRQIFTHVAADTFTWSAEFALDCCVCVDYIFIDCNENLDSFYASGQAKFSLAS